MDERQPLCQLAPDLWVADQPLRFFGLELGARMTVVRLPGARLLLHSPLARSAGLAAEVERLGAVTFVVAPNRFHHLFVHEWQAAHPSARTYVAPGLETKRRDLTIADVLGEHALPEWSGVLDQALLRGVPFTNEVVFFHRPSSTLIASDLAFNIGPESPTLTRLVFHLGGAYGRLSSPLPDRFLIRDRSAFRRSLERVLEWPISRVVVAHGAVVEQDGHAALAHAFSWL